MTASRELREPGSILTRFPYLNDRLELLRWLVNTDEPVLVTGESGTGKSVLAKLIHADSLRSEKKCGVVHVSTLSSHLAASELFGHRKGAFTGAIENRKGVIEECDGGTFIIEEVGDLPPDLQMILLDLLDNHTIRRVGEDTPRPVSVRIVCTTNRNLYQEVRAGRFRHDLLRRILVGYQVAMPSITQIPAQCCEQTLLGMAREKQREYSHLIPEKEGGFFIEPGVLDRLRVSCEGNYRTLLSLSLILARNGRLTLQDLVALVTETQEDGLKGKVSPSELARVLSETGGNQREAARRLGVSEGTVRRLRKKHDI